MRLTFQRFCVPGRPLQYRCSRNFSHFSLPLDGVRRIIVGLTFEGLCVHGRVVGGAVGVLAKKAHDVVVNPTEVCALCS